jgi:urease accessory protein
MNKYLTAMVGALAFVPVNAFAHHPLGGMTPSSFTEGFLSGVGHPVIGLDHLAFVVAMGVAAWLAGSRFVAPLFFILAAMAGTGLHLMSIGLPFVEVVIAASVAIIGLMLMSGRNFGVAAYSALFAVAGLFHGHAYGEAVFGAEATPVFAYLAGFGMIQYVIAISAGYLVCEIIGRKSGSINNLVPRLTGGMVAGAGGLLIGEHLLTALGLG